MAFECTLYPFRTIDRSRDIELTQNRTVGDMIIGNGDVMSLQYTLRVGKYFLAVLGGNVIERSSDNPGMCYKVFVIDVKALENGLKRFKEATGREFPIVGDQLKDVITEAFKSPYDTKEYPNVVDKSFRVLFETR